jgi:hypothetical protein
MKKLALLLLIVTPLLAQFDPATFLSPPVQYRGHAMWSFPLSTLNENYITTGIEEMAKLNYGGFFIEPGGGPTTGLSDAYIKLFRRGQTDSRGVVYLSDEYFRFYKLAMEEAKKRGMEVVLYDDYSFPTGTVGGQLFLQVSPVRGQEPGNDGTRRHGSSQSGTTDSPRGPYVDAHLQCDLSEALRLFADEVLSGAMV